MMQVEEQNFFIYYTIQWGTIIIPQVPHLRWVFIMEELYLPDSTCDENITTDWDVSKS